MHNLQFMKKISLTLGLVSVLLGLTSCIDQQTIKQAVKEAAEEMAEEMYDNDDEGFRDSDKWGKVTTKEIRLAAFDKVEINGVVDAIYNNADTCRVTMHGNEKVMENYTFKSEGGVLVVEPKKGLRHSPSLTIHVTSPDLSAYISNGTGDLDIKSHVDFDMITFKLNGTGDIDIDDMACGRLTVESNGTGDIKLRNVECQGSADFTVCGVGDVKARVDALDINVTNSGTGDTELDVNCKNLVAENSGVGEIELEGATTTFTRKTSGLSKIDSKDLKATIVKR